MESKSTVAVSQQARLRLKKLSALLNLTQGTILEEAIRDFERKVLQKPEENSLNSISDDIVEKALQEATKEVWAADPIHKALQLKLKQSQDSIDDYIITKWDPGFDI